MWVLEIQVKNQTYEITRVVWNEKKGFTVFVQVNGDVVTGTALSFGGALHHAKLSVLEYLRSKEDTVQIRRPIK